MAFDLTTVRFSPILESELARINELSNLPEIAEHFETIPPVPMETTLSMWRYIQSGIVSLWGIHHHDRIIGGLGYYTQPPGTRLSHGATFFLYLEPAFQGNGIGMLSLRFLEQQITSRGYLRMDCMVADTNPRAIRLYERCGFEREGIRKKAFLINGQYRDLILMGKIFPDSSPGITNQDS